MSSGSIAAWTHGWATRSGFDSCRTAAARPRCVGSCHAHVCLERPLGIAGQVSSLLRFLDGKDGQQATGSAPGLSSNRSRLPTSKPGDSRPARGFLLLWPTERHGPTVVARQDEQELGRISPWRPAAPGRVYRCVALRPARQRGSIRPSGRGARDRRSRRLARQRRSQLRHGFGTQCRRRRQRLTDSIPLEGGRVSWNEMFGRLPLDRERAELDDEMRRSLPCS